MKTKAAFILITLLSLSPWSILTAQPQYQIYDVGVVQTGDASQGLGVSNAGIAVGRSLRNNGSSAFTWTVAGGLVPLPNLAARAYCVSNSANDNGIVVGTGATTSFGSSRLPVIWQNGAVSQLPLPAGQTLGDANHVNASGTAAGSCNAGSLQRGVIYSGSNATIITQTTAGGSYFLTAFGINDSGRVVGQGIDPVNAARNVGIVYDIGFVKSALNRCALSACGRGHLRCSIWARFGEGFAQRSPLREHTPHPPSLCDGTLSHKGRG